MAQPAGGSAPQSELYTMRRAFVIVLLLVFGYLAMLVFAPFASYLFMGALFVYLLHPLYGRVLRSVRRPGLAAGIMIVFVLLAILAPLGWIGMEVVGTARDAVDEFDVPTVVAIADDALMRVYDLLGIETDGDTSATYALLNATLPAIQERARAILPSVISFAGSLTLGLFVMAFTIYYGLKDGPRFVDYVRSALPLERSQSGALLEEIRRTVDAVFLGHIIVSVIQGVVGGIGFVIFGVPHAIFWGFVMILLALIPVIGPPIVWIPAAIYLFAVGDTAQAIGLVLWGALLVGTLDNVIRPRIVGNYADIHPLVVLVGVLGGIIAFGFIGFVMGPLVIAILVAVINFWRTDYLPRVAEPGAPPPPRPGDTPGLPPP